MKKNRMLRGDARGLLKVLKIMKLSVFLVLVFALQGFATNSYSQQKQVTLELKNVKVLNVLNEIERTSDYYFLFNKDLVNVDRIVSLSANQSDVKQVLEDLFEGTNVNFVISDRQIVLTTEGSSISQPDEKKTVKGKVTDASGVPLPGVTVVVKGTTQGIITDMDGNYTLSNVPGDATLIFSFVGMKPQEIPVEGKSIINASLAEETVGIDEVVAVGYGTQKKTSMTAAVSAVKGEEIKKSVVPNISGALAGNVAGVSMRPNGGQPGRDNPDIHIRGIATTGNNAPLVVVDGVIRDNINEISPDAIESVTVLKDASAVAPYGLGGANGVILITTKQGQTGAPVLTLNSYYGFQTPTYFPKMLNAQDYMSLRNEAFLNSNPNATTLPFATDYIANYKQLNADDPDKYPINDALNQLVDKEAPITATNLDISGGTEKVKYYAGLGFIDQKGMFDNTNYRRYTYNLNLSVDVTNTTNLTFNINGAIQRTNDVEPGIGTDRVFRAAYKYVPIAPLYYSNGLWGEFAGNTPVGMLKAGYNRDDRTTTLASVGFKQEIPFIKGLSLQGKFSYDPTTSVTKGWHTPHYYYSLDTSTDPYTYTKQISTNEGWVPTYTYLTQGYWESQNFTYQGMINYGRTFGKHSVSGLLVAEARENNVKTFDARRNNFAINIDELSLGSSDKADFDNSGSSSTGSQLGYVYRVNYEYDGKYLFEASGRYDGHYYFAPGKRWGYFPAFSAGWLISNENFMSSTSSYLDKLKLRGSWGRAGNLAGGPFQYLNGYTLYGNAYAYSGNGTLVQGSYVDVEANPNITWEISTKSDIGFEASLWRSLLRVEADYFFEKRTGMLLPPAITVPQEYGINLSEENAGVMKNHGFEIIVGSAHSFRNGMRLSVNGNFSYSKNKMEQVFETGATYNNPNRRRTGRALNTPFGYHALGLFSMSDDVNGDGIINSEDGYNVTQFGTLHPGDIRYADISGPDGTPDGKIDSNDETVIGDPVYPSITYGFTPTLEWKGFDLSLFFQGAGKSSLDIRGFQTIPFNSNNSNASYEYFNNHWTPVNPSGKYPRADQSPVANNTQNSDFWMISTAYLRLKTGVLGYTIPSRLTQRINLQKVRLYVSGQNLFTMSKLDYMDPEVGYNGPETAYPTQKVYTFGLNVTF